MYVERKQRRRQNIIDDDSGVQKPKKLKQIYRSA